MDPIIFFNRHTGEHETEQVYGEGFLRWVYGNPLGRLALHGLAKRSLFSKWYGYRMDRPTSRKRIAPFIEKYGLDSSEFLDDPDSFESFNAFFWRKLIPEARPIDSKPDSVVFPADGRHLGFQKASDIESVFIKGQRFDLAALLGDAKLAEQYSDGALVLSRLCPIDYHRFHFPVAGIPGPLRIINGPLFSVSPIALRQQLGYLWQNKRVVTPVATEDMGIVQCLEIGATCVGSIHQTFTPEQPVEKGAEKGYFAFGGSSTLTLFEPGTVTLAQDLLDHSAQQTELYAQMGTPMGRKA
ncbi:MAG: phosphatidylserine decarboxylase [Akkermansiaceae bacterium]|nr:phosphatidylserine decarboxylase [Akkermansiaceae bacterium]